MKATNEKHSSTIKIHVLQCGNVIVDSTLPFFENTLNPLAFTGFLRSNIHKITLPVFAFLIEHPKGLILVDTGWDTLSRTHPVDALNRLHIRINYPVLPENQAIDEQLKNLGYHSNDIDYLILTHLDVDHAGGLQLVKNAKHILVTETEWEAANRLGVRYLPKMWKNIDFERIVLNEEPYGPEKRALDLFHDDSVLLVSLPGHSEGMMGVLVQHDSRFVLLTGDCGYAERSWKEQVMPGICVDKGKLEKSLQWVREQSQMEGCEGVFASHDAGVQPHCIEI